MFGVVCADRVQRSSRGPAYRGPGLPQCPAYCVPRFSQCPAYRVPWGARSRTAGNLGDVFNGGTLYSHRLYIAPDAIFDFRMLKIEILKPQFASVRYVADSDDDPLGLFK